MSTTRSATLTAVALLGLALTCPALAVPALTDAQIRQLIIEESLRSYPGNCPCPWHTDSAGRRCGKRSAYERRSGYAPICFAHDISDEQVEAFRKARHIEKL